MKYLNQTKTTVINQIEKKFIFVFTVISTLWKKCLIYELFEIIHHCLLISVALTSCAVTGFNFQSISIQYIIFFTKFVANILFALLIYTIRFQFGEISG